MFDLLHSLTRVQTESPCGVELHGRVTVPVDTLLRESQPCQHWVTVSGPLSGVVKETQHHQPLPLKSLLLTNLISIYTLQICGTYHWTAAM